MNLPLLFAGCLASALIAATITWLVFVPGLKRRAGEEHALYLHYHKRTHEVISERNEAQSRLTTANTHIAELESRLAKFSADKPRDAKGLFLPAAKRREVQG